MNRREEILAMIPSIPALPTAAAKVLSLLQDPHSGISDIMQAVEYDPGLTSNVLRLANSAYFAGPRKISSLREAGVLFGTSRITQLVLASAIAPVAQQEIKGYDLPPGRLLDNLVAVAIGAEELARALKIVAPPHLFTAALLHDIGKVVLGTFVEIDAGPIVELAFNEKISFDVAERSILGIDHAEIGAALLEFWKIPEEVVKAVRWHHEPEGFPGDSLVVDLVHVADQLSIECGIGVGVDGLNYRPSQAVVERLHLKGAVAEQVTCTMLAGLGTIRSQLFANGGGTQNGA
jgi:putative nucleotidyltransferase with HDIG domain